MGQDNAASSVAPSAPMEPTVEEVETTPASNTTAQPEELPAANGTGSLSMTCMSELNEVSYNDTKDVLLLAHLVARPVEEKKRAPVSITAVIDRSGSMAGEKLKLVTESMRFVISQLTADDRFGIVAYDDHITVPLSLTRMNSTGKDSALAAINSIKSGGSTNLSGGLFAGIQQQLGGHIDYQPTLQRANWFKRAASASFRAASNTLQQLNPATWFANGESEVASRSVWLFTDGLANAGITVGSELVDATRKALGDSDATVYTFGFGSDHDANLLKQVAEVGHGMYYYIEDTTKIAVSFADCLGGLLSVAAKEIELELEVPARHKIVQSYTWYTHTVISDRKWKIKIHDMYGEEQRDIMLMIRLPNDVPIQQSVECGKWSLAYTDTIANRRAHSTETQTIGRPEHANPGTVPVALDAQRNRVRCTEALEASKALANANKLEDARAMLAKCEESIKVSASCAAPMCVDILNDLSDAKSRMVHHETYITSGKQMMECYEMSHKQQRSNVTSSYCTSAKAKCKALV